MLTRATCSRRAARTSCGRSAFESKTRVDPQPGHSSDNAKNGTHYLRFKWPHIIGSNGDTE